MHLVEHGGIMHVRVVFSGPFRPDPECMVPGVRNELEHCD